MPGEIEFLDAEPAPGDTEELRQPSRHGSPVRRRARVAVGAGLALLVGGLLVGRAATSNGGTPLAESATSPSTGRVVGSAHASRSAVVPRPARSASASPSASLAIDPATGLITGLAKASCFPSSQIGRVVRLPAAPGGHPQRCVKVAPAQCPESDDGQIACLVARELPVRVLDAIRARYPDAQVTFAYTEIARQTQLLWYRVIRLSVAPKVSMVITLEQSGFDPGESVVLDTSALQQVRAVRTTDRLNTTVVVIAPSAAGANLGLPSDLVSDGRLASVS